MILLGDCLEQMKTLEANSVDAVITDPPYGLSFMGKKWDYDVPSVDIWREVLRVLKPGGHVLSFGGTRTYHRMVVNMEDAGFEIRDQVQWIYGSGFPKSHNIGKAIAKLEGQDLVSVGEGRSGSSSRAYQSEDKTTAGKYQITKADNERDGWGSALKPANEPICLARKPLEKGLTLAENVLKWGTGGLNIDGTRIGFSENEKIDFNRVQDGNIYGANGVYGKAEQKETTPLFKQNGRWPTNVIFDEEAAAVLDLQVSSTMKMHGAGNKKTGKPKKIGDKSLFGIGTDDGPSVHYDHGEDSTKASRFFYVAKASKSERNRGLAGMPERERPLAISQWEGQTNGSGETMGPSKPQQNHHPTVKPIKLMEYLITLITPPNGVVLDPFMGSGSTGVAAKNLKREFIGIEMNEEYVEIAKKRIGSV